MLFCVSLTTGVIRDYICQGIALKFSRNINKFRGNPILLQSNQHLSTLRQLNSKGTLVFFEEKDGNYLTEHVGSNESFIQRHFTTTILNESWLPPISIHSGKSY